MEEIIRKLVEKMKENPKRLKKTFENVPTLLPIIKLIQQRAKEEILDELRDFSCRDAPNVCQCCQELEELMKRHIPNSQKEG